MKKISLLIALVLIFTLSIGVSANSKGNTEAVGGITYNTFALNDEAEDELKNGFGFYGGGQYWINSQIAIGAGIDYARASTTIEEQTTETDVSHNITGPYAKLNFKVNEMISLNAGGAFYSYTAESESSFGSISFDGSGLGLLFGGKADYPIQNNLKFTADLNYRLLDVEMDNEQLFGNETLDMNGLRAGVALSYKF